MRDLNNGEDLFLYTVAARTSAVATLHPPGMASISPDADSYLRGLSADGRWTLFEGSAGNLVPGQVDGNSQSDVFLYDHTTRKSLLVSHVERFALHGRGLRLLSGLAQRRRPLRRLHQLRHQPRSGSDRLYRAARDGAAPVRRLPLRPRHREDPRPQPLGPPPRPHRRLRLPEAADQRRRPLGGVLAVRRPTSSRPPAPGPATSISMTGPRGS